MVELAVRLVFSLAVVVGLLLVTVKLGARKFRPRKGAAVRIVHRQALSRGSAVAVVEVGGRTLVLGTTDHQVNVLAELDEGELDRADLSLVDELPDPAESPAAQVIAIEDGRHAQPVLLEADVPPAQPKRRAGSHAARPAPKRKRVETRPAPAGPLTGSVLSPQTWRQALAAASGRAS